MLREEHTQSKALPDASTSVLNALEPTGDLYLVIADETFLRELLAFAVPFTERETPRLLTTGNHFILVDEAVWTAASSSPPLEIQMASLLAMDGVFGRTIPLPGTPSSTLIDAQNIVVPHAVEAPPLHGEPPEASIQAVRGATQQRFSKAERIETEIPPMQDLVALADRFLFRGFHDSLLLSFKIWQEYGVESTDFTRLELLVLTAAFANGVEFPDLTEFARATNLGSDGGLVEARERLQELGLVEVRRVQRGRGRPRYRLQPGPLLENEDSLFEAIAQLDEQSE